MKRSVVVLTLAGLAVGSSIFLRRVRRTFSFANKVILITGGSQGLGLALARQLCEEGARVALLARDQNQLDKARDELIGTGGDVFTISCDLLERAHVETAVQKVVNRFGRLDVLINNAGIIEVGPLDHMQREDFERALNLHFWAPLDLTIKAIPHLRRSGNGRIVNIASIGGKVAVPHLAPYCASKFALVGLSDSLRAELAREHICVTTVTPGLMRTGSQGNAHFRGNHSAEHTWFSLSTAMPLSSISTEQAAARIVSACRRGVPSLTFPFVAQAAILGNALLPNVSGNVTKLVNTLLPSPTGPDGDVSRSGRELSDLL